jgi:hypothetical protein
MSETKRSALQTHQLLLSMLIGIFVSGASVIAYINSEREMPFAANLVVSTVSLAVFPGYIVTATLSNNIHNANLLIAGAINFVLYSGLSLWLITWRSRRKLAARTGVDR